MLKMLTASKSANTSHKHTHRHTEFNKSLVLFEWIYLIFWCLLWKSLKLLFNVNWEHPMLPLPNPPPHHTHLLTSQHESHTARRSKLESSEVTWQKCSSTTTWKTNELIQEMTTSSYCYKRWIGHRILFYFIFTHKETQEDSNRVYPHVRQFEVQTGTGWFLIWWLLETNDTEEPHPPQHTTHTHTHTPLA